MPVNKASQKALKSREEILIGTTTYCHKKSVMRFGKYANGQLAIQCYDPKSHEPTFKPTVSMPAPPAEGCVWLKGWNENDGVIDAMIKAGVVSLTGRAQPTGYNNICALEARLLV